MSQSYSEKRVKCKDYFKRHKKVVYKTSEKLFTHVGNLASLLQKYLGSVVTVNEQDEVCRNGYVAYKKTLGYDILMEDEAQETSAASSEDTSYILPEVVIGALNTSIDAVEANISPFKQPHDIRCERRTSYYKRKTLEFETRLSEAATSKLGQVSNR